MKLSGNLQVLIDCSSFLSGAFYPKGKPRRILQLWQNGEIEVIVSKEIIKEYNEKIETVAKRMKKNIQIGEFYLDLVKKEGIVVTPIKVDSQICRDPHDLKYLEAAVAGQVDFLISSDKDLLVLKKFEKIKIITPAKFLNFREKSQEE